MFDFDPIYLFYLLIGASAAMFAEGLYLLFYNKSSYRKNINRRLKVMDDKTDRESVLIQLRREPCTIQLARPPVWVVRSRSM